MPGQLPRRTRQARTARPRLHVPPDRAGAPVEVGQQILDGSAQPRDVPGRDENAALSVLHDSPAGLRCPKPRGPCPSTFPSRNVVMPKGNGVSMTGTTTILACVHAPQVGYGPRRPAFDVGRPHLRPAPPGVGRVKTVIGDEHLRCLRAGPKQTRSRGAPSSRRIPSPRASCPGPVAGTRTRYRCHGTRRVGSGARAARSLCAGTSWFGEWTRIRSIRRYGLNHRKTNLLAGVSRW